MAAELLRCVATLWYLLPAVRQAHFSLNIFERDSIRIVQAYHRRCETTTPLEREEREEGSR
jgi:hypothetical protein